MADEGVPVIGRSERLGAAVALLVVVALGLICADVLSGGWLSARMSGGGKPCEGCGDD